MAFIILIMKKKNKHHKTDNLISQKPPKNKFGVAWFNKYTIKAEKLK